MTPTSIASCSSAPPTGAMKPKAAKPIAAALRPGARLPFALYRMEGKSPRLYLAWSPTKTPKPNFHVPEAFGTLVVE